MDPTEPTDAKTEIKKEIEANQADGENAEALKVSNAELLSMIPSSYYSIPLLGGYRFTDLGSPAVLEATHVIDGLALNYNLGAAMKYLVRQGRKPDNSAKSDIAKARDYLNMELERIEREEALKEVKEDAEEENKKEDETPDHEKHGFTD